MRSVRLNSRPPSSGVSATAPVAARQQRLPVPLSSGEEVILGHQGFCKETLRSGWKPGQLCLTNQRLLLAQPTRVLFQVPLAGITGIALEERRFILRAQGVLRISYRRPTHRDSATAWVMAADIETWKKRIFERTLLRVDRATIEQVLGELEPESQRILSHIWEHQHATIEELASLYEAPNHMDVLQRIRKVINPASERILGFPVLTFERSKIDEVTGGKVLFSWWIMGRQGLQAAAKEPLLDVFDEGAYVNIVAEVVGVREEDILVEVFEDSLKVTAKSPEADFREVIPLPEKVDPQAITRRYHNNILELRLQKLKA